MSKNGTTGENFLKFDPKMPHLVHKKVSKFHQNWKIYKITSSLVLSGFKTTLYLVFNGSQNLLKDLFKEYLDEKSCDNTNVIPRWQNIVINPDKSTTHIFRGSK